MRIGYFTEQYPDAGLAFIWSEIHTLEGRGQTVIRYALRCERKSFADPEDILKLNKAQNLCELSAAESAQYFLRTCLRSLVSVAKVLWLAAKIGQHSDRGLLGEFGNVWKATVLAACCRRDLVEHLHAHSADRSATIAMFAAALVDIPFSFAARRPEEFESASLLSLDEKLRRAAFAVCASTFGRCQLMLSTPPDLWPKIAVVHDGIDKNSVANDIAPVPTEPKLVCIGQLDDRKAHLVLVEAVRRLRDKGIQCHVVLVGDGPMRPNIEAAIRGANLQGAFRITGWVPDDILYTELASARGLVVPSFTEDIPVAVIEAMAKGRPVISTYVGGIPELITPGKTGWLVPPGDYDALANAIQNVIEASEEMLSTFAAAGCARVLERHDAMREAAKLEQLFEAARPDAASDQQSRVTQAVKILSW